MKFEVKLSENSVLEEYLDLRRNTKRMKGNAELKDAISYGYISLVVCG